MKAKEYAEKYKDLQSEFVRANGDLFIEKTMSLYKDLREDFSMLCKARNVKTFDGAYSAARDVNNKANRINQILGHPLKDDWFTDLLSRDVAYIKHRLEMEKIAKDINKSIMEENND